MKIVDRYISFSILKTGLATLLICTLIILAVELFGQMNDYLTSQLPFSTILQLSILAVPEYLMMCVSISFLFATTFFLSQLEGNNEMIMLLNSGLSYRRVCRPVILTVLVVTILAFIFSQTLMIEAKSRHDRLSVELFGQSSTSDASDVTVSEAGGHFLVNANYFDEARGRLFTVTLVSWDGEGRVRERLEASYADWDAELGCWTFTDGVLWVLSGDEVTASRFDTLTREDVTTAPVFFTDESRDMSTMPTSVAFDHLRRLREVDVESWYPAASDFYSRLASPFSILVLTLVCLMMNYRFKRNVFLFSIIQSLCTAVVYYVLQMLCSIMTSQALFHPSLGVIIPVVATLALALAIRLIGRING